MKDSVKADAKALEAAVIVAHLNDVLNDLRNLDKKRYEETINITKGTLHEHDKCKNRDCLERKKHE